MSFWNLKPSGDSTDAELRIDGEIVMENWWSAEGYICAKDFRNALKTVGDVTVYINSPGGDVFAGAEIYSALKEHDGHVTVKISGIAASAASVIAMAGDEILMSPVAYMMIHDPWSIAMGNAREMEHEAKILREIGEGIIAAYTERTGKTHDEIAAMLADETYMSAQTCIDEGFADGFYGADSGDSVRTQMRANNYSARRYCAMLHHDESGKAFHEIAAKLGDEFTVHAPDSGDPQPEGDEKRRDAMREYARVMAEIYA